MNWKWTITGQLSVDGQVRDVAVEPTPLRVGRRSDVALCLQRPTISGHHAELFSSDDGLFVRDLGSTNGTYVNGGRVEDQAELQDDDLVQFADMPFRVRRTVANASSQTICEDVCDRALALVQFDKLLTEHAVIPYFQPVVNIRTREILGYEILGRSRLVGLETPHAMFQAAAQLNLEVELSTIMRLEGIRASCEFPEPPHVFINTHPAELAGDKLLEAVATLRMVAPSQRITVEIHEAAVTDVSTMRQFRDGLDELGCRLAFDDFGSGQNRLVELAEVRPHYLKFDRQMICDIDKSAQQRRQMLAGLVKIVKDLEVVPLAEGVETEGEAEVCRELEFELAQGFYYGRPAPVRAYCRPELSPTVG